MSYQPFDFSIPTRICFGAGEGARAAEYAASFAPRRLMVATYADMRLPVLDALLSGLEARGVPYALYPRCTANPRAEQVDAAAAFCADNGCDMVLGVGGGSVIDTAKAVALLTANPIGGGIWAYVGGGAEPQNPALPVMLVVTIASTGSESNESFVLTDRAGRQKLIYSTPSVRPRLSVCDPALSVTLPPRQTALGAADVFSHLLEQYLHRDTAVDVSDNMCRGVMEAVVKWAPVAVAEPENLDARANLLWASILAMSRVLGVGHRENWISHMLEHAVSAKYGVPHAAGMAAILPAYLQWLAPRDAAGRLPKIAPLFGAEDAAEGLGGFLRGLGLPAGLTEPTGARPGEAELRELAQNALPWGGLDAGGYGPFTQDDAYAVLKAAFQNG